MFPQIDAAALAAKYGMRVLGVLALIGVTVGGYYYIKHTGATEQHEKDIQEITKRNQIEQKQSDKLLEDARAEVAAIKAKHDQIYIGVLTSASQTIKTTQSERDAAVSELRKLRQRATATTSNINAESGKARVSEGGIGGTGDVGCEVSTAEIEQRLEISRMAELSLLATGYIREVSIIK